MCALFSSEIIHTVACLLTTDERTQEVSLQLRDQLRQILEDGCKCWSKTKHPVKNKIK